MQLNGINAAQGVPPINSKAERSRTAEVIRLENLVFADPTNQTNQRKYLEALQLRCNTDRMDSYDLAFLLILMHYKHSDQASQLLKSILPEDLDKLISQCLDTIPEAELTQLASLISPRTLCSGSGKRITSLSLFCAMISSPMTPSALSLFKKQLRTNLLSLDPKRKNDAPLDATLTPLFWAELLLILDAEEASEILYTMIQSYEAQTPQEKLQKAMLEWVLWTRSVQGQPSSPFPLNISGQTKDSLLCLDQEDLYCLVRAHFLTLPEDSAEKRVAQRFSLMLSGNHKKKPNMFGYDNPIPDLKTGVQDGLFLSFFWYLHHASYKISLACLPINNREDRIHTYTFYLYTRASLMCKDVATNEVDQKLASLRNNLFQTIPQQIINALQTESMTEFRKHLFARCTEKIELVKNSLLDQAAKRVDTDHGLQLLLALVLIDCKEARTAMTSLFEYRRTLYTEIDVLPNDILFLIFNQLPLTSIARFRAVCKKWNCLLRCQSLGNSITRAYALPKIQGEDVVFNIGLNRCMRSLTSLASTQLNQSRQFMGFEIPVTPLWDSPQPLLLSPSLLFTRVSNANPPSIELIDLPSLISSTGLKKCLLPLALQHPGPVHRIYPLPDLRFLAMTASAISCHHLRSANDNQPLSAENLPNGTQCLWEIPNCDFPLQNLEKLERPYMHNVSIVGEEIGLWTTKGPVILDAKTGKTILTIPYPSELNDYYLNIYPIQFNRDFIFIRTGEPHFAYRRQMGKAVLIKEFEEPYCPSSGALFHDNSMVFHAHDSLVKKTITHDNEIIETKTPILNYYAYCEYERYLDGEILARGDHVALIDVGCFTQDEESDYSLLNVRVYRYNNETRQDAFEPQTPFSFKFSGKEKVTALKIQFHLNFVVVNLLGKTKSGDNWQRLYICDIENETSKILDLSHPLASYENGMLLDFTLDTTQMNLYWTDESIRDRPNNCNIQ